MIYYAVLYMTDGQIHLMPHETKEEAEKTIEEAKKEKFGSKIVFSRVVKKDPNKDWYKSVNGYWI